MKVSEFLSKVSLFSGLNDEDLDELVGLCCTVNKNKNEIIFNKGDIEQKIYIVCTGSVEIFTIGENRTTIPIANFNAGQVFGELTIFNKVPRTAYARAVEDSVLLELSHDDFLELLKKHSTISISLLSILSKRLYKTNTLMQSYAARNANIEMEMTETFGEKLSDKFASIVGSWTFVITFLIISFVWLVVNTIVLFFKPFDPYPYLLFTTVLASLAAFQAPVILMTQNRQAKKDRLLAEIDYKVSLQSEVWLQELKRKIEKLQDNELAMILSKLDQIEQAHAELEKKFKNDK